VKTGKTVSCAALVLMALCAAANAVAAPKMALTSLNDLPIAIQQPYDNTSGMDAVNAALQRGENSGKRILIDVGGNWCPDCRILANLMQRPELKGFLAAHFEIVMINVGRYDRNLDVPARFGLGDKPEGVPAIVIAEPNGTVVNKGKYFALSDARHMMPQDIANWLAGWAK
jgi:thiol-disulfide isomerase/thioredoxin